MWSDKSKSIMRDAAVLAGLTKKDDPRDKLMLISEPEAAALYCERSCDKFDIEEGDNFMICDAGGMILSVLLMLVEVYAHSLFDRWNS